MGNPIADFAHFLSVAQPGDAFTRELSHGVETLVFRTLLTVPEMLSLDFFRPSPVDPSWIGRGGMLDSIKTKYHPKTYRPGQDSACYISDLSAVCHAVSLDQFGRMVPMSHSFTLNAEMTRIPSSNPMDRLVNRIIEPEDGNAFSAARLETVHRMAMDLHAERAAPFLTVH